MIGTTLGRYKILAKLGEGGMGEVYRARDTTLDRDVALKLLPAEIADDAQRRARFEQEAKAVAALSHPNILAIYEFGQDQGRSFAAMELLDGESLRERLQQGPLRVRRALALAAQVADGLAAAHERGIVHRDLKPDNIFVTTDGRAKILDFGLARVEARAAHPEDSATAALLTDPGTVMGTVGYMSPEQVRGDAVDARSDIFSLGVVLYETLTATQPFAGDSAAEMMGAILRDEPRSIRDRNDTLPEGLDRIVQHCLEKRAEERFQSARDLGFALRSAMAPSQTELAVRVQPARARGIRLSPLVAVAVLGWVVAALLFGLLHSRSPEPHAPARLRTLTYSGRDWAPSASPSGDMIAFASDRDGVSRIWLKQMVGGAETPVTTGPDDYPRFSPDGSQILFIRDLGGIRDLYRTSVVGSEPRRILGDILEADWSPDGSQVAFLRPRPTGDEDLVVVGVADYQTGEERELTEIRNRTCYGIRWSPDGTRIAVTQATQTGMMSQVGGINLIDVASGDRRRITLTDWGGPYTAIHWAPDGHSIIAGQADEPLARVSGIPGQIMEFNLESGVRRALLWTVLHLPHGGMGRTVITALDAQRLVIDEHILRARLCETVWPEEDTHPALKALTGGLGRDRQPAYSPDGERIVFSSNCTGNVDLWILDRATGLTHQLTDDPATDWDPAFTPDGNHVLWSSDRSGPMEIWIAATDGSRPRQITRDGVDAENPTMTADGEWVVYTSANDEKLGIWKIRTDGTEAMCLIPGPQVLPDVSPDGRYALFMRRFGLNSVIRVLEIETAEIVPFEIEIASRELQLNILLGRARWTADGRAILFIGQDEEGRSGVYVQDFVPGSDTSDSRRPLVGFSDDYITESLGLSPDGKHVTISAMVDRRSLKLAEYVTLSGWD